jgi:hypothetical protein
MHAVDPWVRETIHSVVQLGVMAATGVIGYFWGRRRVRERDLFLLWRAAFDRPAFRGLYQVHSSEENFRRAISTVLKTVATGVLFDSNGHELNRVSGVYYGPSQIRSAARRDAVIDVQGRLQKLIRLSYRPRGTADLDGERNAIVKSMNAAWKTLNIAPMTLPTDYKDPDDIQFLLKELQEEVTQPAVAADKR